MDEEQITDLIHKYESELIKIKFQEEKINDIIVELRIMRKNVKSDRIDDVSNHNIILDSQMYNNKKNNIPLKSDEPDTLSDWYYESEEAKNGYDEELVEDNKQIIPPIKKRGRGRPRKAQTSEENLDIDTEENYSDDKPKRERKKGGYQLSDWDRFLLNTLNSEQVMMTTSDMFDVSRIYTDQKSLGYTDDQIRGKISRSITKLTKRPDGIIRYESIRKGYVYGLADWFSKKGEPKYKYSKGL